MDYEELERRNQKHFDRLMELLKRDPEEALKYAIPLDTDGVGRGGNKGSFELQKRWMDFSLSNSGWNSGAGRAILSDDAFTRLHNQYLYTAQELMKQKEYKKAAFVYMKLLKNYLLAAQALEAGAHYGEAASLYLKYCNNQLKAAQCFEKGKMLPNAIELYKELKQHEKVGDLYLDMGNKKEAVIFYQNEADNYLQNQQYLKASLLYKNKMENTYAAQEVLLKGWREGKDHFNCLNNYFANITDLKELSEALQAVYQREVHKANRETFLQVLKYEYNKQTELSGIIKEMAYETIVEQVRVNPAIVSELHFFNKEDKQLVKDTMRYKVNLKRL